jgi:hypothetical protein
MPAGQLERRRETPTAARAVPWHDHNNNGRVGSAEHQRQFEQTARSATPCAVVGHDGQQQPARMGGEAARHVHLTNNNQQQHLFNSVGSGTRQAAPFNIAAGTTSVTGGDVQTGAVKRQPPAAFTSPANSSSTSTVTVAGGRGDDRQPAPKKTGFRRDGVWNQTSGTHGDRRRARRAR